MATAFTQARPSHRRKKYSHTGRMAMGVAVSV